MQEAPFVAVALGVYWSQDVMQEARAGESEGEGQEGKVDVTVEDVGV